MTKTTHALVMFDYNGADPSFPNVHAFGFMQIEETDRGLDRIGWPIQGYEVAQELAHRHWRKHLTYTVRGALQYEVQHVFAYEPAVLIEHLFRWGVDFNKFDPTLPKEAK